ncbi:MAG: carboxymuconolactone decarboxylase family protein [Thermoleophilia bacterium]|nr:carboxymuconolactone decarboxylase family protein [Thermoleophilia bacterium]
MQDIPKPYAQFKARFPQILERNEELGTFIHEHGGPLDEKTRWLVKLGISAASRHQTGVTTHAARAKEAGASQEEIVHALLLVIPTCGFPTFMEAYNQIKTE